MRVRANAVGVVGEELEALLGELEAATRRHDDDRVRELLRGVAALSRPAAEAPAGEAAPKAVRAGNR
jgi:hypothetical protein